MKIVHLSLLSLFSDKYSYQDNLLPKYHKKLGHDVTIIAPIYSEYDKDTGKVKCEPAGKSLLGNGISLIRLKPAFPYIINRHIRAFLGFKKVLNELNPDLIFAHSVTTYNFVYLKKYKKSHPHVKIVFDNHADMVNSCHNALSYFYSRYIVRNLVVKKLINVSEHFYGVTPARCEFLHDIYGVPLNKISLLPMGADDDEMMIENKEALRNDVRMKYNIGKDEFLIVTGGKIDLLKNIHTLAKAVKYSKYSDIKILIFGSIRDDMKDVFKNLVSERVVCVGWIASNDVYKYFYAADVVVFPGLHSVLWEQAIASQVPCAFSKIKGFEHVDVGGNCILMEGKTEDYYLSLIEMLYKDTHFYEQLYKNSHSESTNQFLYSRIAQKVIIDIVN